MDTAAPSTGNCDVECIRKIVERHSFPPFVTGFDVQLGEFDAEPALWIIFRTTGPRPEREQDRRSRAEALSTLREKVHEDLRQHIDDRYPYFRFENIDALRSLAE